MTGRRNQLGAEGGSVRLSQAPAAAAESSSVTGDAGNIQSPLTLQPAGSALASLSPEAHTWGIPKGMWPCCSCLLHLWVRSPCPDHLHVPCKPLPHCPVSRRLPGLLPTVLHKGKFSCISESRSEQAGYGMYVYPILSNK